MNEFNETVRLPVPPGQPPPDPAEGSITFIGNATLLIQCGGFTILTDPTFIHKGEQLPVGFGLHTTRLTNPAIEIGDLPPLDLVLLSHWHADHFDQLAERELDKELLIVTRPEAADELIQRRFTNTWSLETWESAYIVKGDSRLRIISMPGRHGPPLTGIMMPEVMGSILEFQTSPQREPYRIYISGDTVVFDEIHDIHRQFPDIDLAILHLGGTQVMGITVTMDGQQGQHMAKIIDAPRVIPVHFNDYDIFKSPLSEFTREMEVEGIGEKVHYLDHGDKYRFQVKAKLLMEA